VVAEERQEEKGNHGKDKEKMWKEVWCVDRHVCWIERDIKNMSAKGADRGAPARAPLPRSHKNRVTGQPAPSYRQSAGHRGSNLPAALGGQGSACSLISAIRGAPRIEPSRCARLRNSKNFFGAHVPTRSKHKPRTHLCVAACSDVLAC
jgi:hypothetical protein